MIKRMRSVFAFFSLLFLLFLPLLASAKHKTIRYGDDQWFVYVNEDKKKILGVLGPWGQYPVVIDRHVRDFWCAADFFGPTVVYLKQENLYWTILQGNSGETLGKGLLLETNPDSGFVRGIVMTPTANGMRIKITLDTGEILVVQVDPHGRKKILRKGKLNLKPE